MTDTEERISKLQKMLDRVLTRADEAVMEPPVEGAVGEAAAPAIAPEATTLSSGEAHRDAAEGGAAIEPAQLAEEAASHPKKPEPAAVVTAPVAPVAEVIPLESRSRLVAADSVEELSDEDLVPDGEMSEDAMPLVRRSRPSLAAAERASDAIVPVSQVERAPESKGAPNSRTDEERLADEIAAEEVLSSELEEEAPTSSRRPIANETIADMADEEYSSPRHTPPPESGRQVAAPMDGGEPSAVRKSAPPMGLRTGAPDVVRAEIPIAAHVAAFTGVPTPARPATFGELLDASIHL